MSGWNGGVEGFRERGTSGWNGGVEGFWERWASRWNGGGRNSGSDGRPGVMEAGDVWERWASGCNGGGGIPGAMGVRIWVERDNE